MPKFDDLTGRTYDKLYVISRAHDYISQSGYRHTQYLCKCECGAAIVISRNNLLSSSKGEKSCGCNKYSNKKRIEWHNVGSCIHNREGVICEEQKCSVCGWNPCNTELKDQRLQN